MAVGLAFARRRAGPGHPARGRDRDPERPGGLRRRRAAAGRGQLRARRRGVAALTGAVEPPAAIAAYGASTLADAALVPGLGFAAGAMLYVIADELIPESHSGGNEREATLALLAGFGLMLALDNAFG